MSSNVRNSGKFRETNIEAKLTEAPVRRPTLIGFSLNIFIPRKFLEFDSGFFCGRHSSQYNDGTSTLPTYDIGNGLLLFIVV